VLWHLFRNDNLFLFFVADFAYEISISIFVFFKKQNLIMAETVCYVGKNN